MRSFLGIVDFSTPVCERAGLRWFVPLRLLDNLGLDLLSTLLILLRLLYIIRVVNRNFSKVSINFLNFSKKKFESKKFRTINF